MLYIVLLSYDRKLTFQSFLIKDNDDIKLGFNVISNTDRLIIPKILDTNKSITPKNKRL